MTNYTRDLNREWEAADYKLVTDIVTVATTITLSDLPFMGAHCFGGVEFFSNATGTPATPGAGSVVVTVKTMANPYVAEAITDGTITAATPKTVDWLGNPQEVIFTPSGITTATHWRANVLANRS